ncbi:MAG: xanthine dehydrogenase accessory protein XdhC [Pseudomonadota bacterium]
MIDLAALAETVERIGKPVARVVIADCKGSTPRETGAAMMVWDVGQSGTIGGGRLELEAVTRARRMLDGARHASVTVQALGPALAQCCGGAVTLVTETFDATRLDGVETQVEKGAWARPVRAGGAEMPDVVRREIERAHVEQRPVRVTFAQGWLLEPVWRARTPVVIYGAGHVGRRLAQVLAPLPAYRVMLTDRRREAFAGLPRTVRCRIGEDPERVMAAASPEAVHLIMTPDHEFDLALCHRLLGREFRDAGLIGSATKWARFRKRLSALGHAPDRIARIACPIGDPSLGKHPHAIAVGVVYGLLKGTLRMAIRKDGAA